MIRRFIARLTGRDPERGQVLIIFALGMVVFLGFAALTVDVGSLYLTRRGYQNAVDAAALAGAAYLTRPISDPCQGVAGTSKPVCARSAAWNYLNNQLNLGLNSGQIGTYAGSNTGAAGQAVVPTGGGDAFDIWVSTPPSGAGAASDASTVRDSQQVLFVRVERRHDVFFGRIFVPQGFHVNAWATAGIFPNRYAVITLRRGQNGVAVDPGPANATDINLAGTTSTLTVINGDIGGNWGMKLNSGSILKIYSTQGDQANVYLSDYISCGNSCWTSGQIQDGSGNPVSPKKLPAFVPDPNYPTPPFNAGSTWPVGPVDNAAPLLDIPRSVSTPTTGSNKDDLVIKQSDPGSVSGNTCSADSPVAGPGWYDNITLGTGKCLILSATKQRTNVFDSSTQTDVPLTQQPGVFYVTGTINIGNGAMIVGDGVTIVIRPTGSGGQSQFSPNSGGVMDLNRGLANGGTAQTLGAWTTKGYSTYQAVGGKWVYQSSYQSNPYQYGVGMAVYVLKPSQGGYTANGGTSVIQVNSGSALAWNGVTYAPFDNVAIAGQPNHDGIGQLVSWTFTFNGGTNVTQTYSGPGDGYPYLIEPCVLVGGSCE